MPHWVTLNPDFVAYLRWLGVPPDLTSQEYRELYASYEHDDRGLDFSFGRFRRRPWQR